jgi:hypothetical protein
VALSRRLPTWRPTWPVTGRPRGIRPGIRDGAARRVQAAVWLQWEWTAAPYPRDRLRPDRRVARGVHRALLGRRGDASGVRRNAPNEGGDSVSTAVGEEGQQLDCQPHCEVHGNQTVHKG